jgi:exocyst complex component 8
MEDFSVAFSEYVRSSSISSSSSSVVVAALKAAKCALSYCSLLFISDSEQHLLDLIAACLREVLTMYARHLKEVTRLFVASDAWVLGRFPVSGILALRAKSPAIAGLQIEYCLLRTSGVKFLTLIQDVVEDVYPLGMNNKFCYGVYN